MSKISLAICNACLKPTEVLNTEMIGIHSKCCNASIVHKNIKVFYRLNFITKTISDKKRKWNGGEHVNKKVLERLGKNVVERNDSNTKFHITMVLEERV